MLRLALVGGPMYDGLYELLPDNVDVVVHADHPTLNRRVAELLAAGESLDVISTHGKYAPSQAAWLHPLDELVPADTVGAFAPRAVALCRFGGHLLCLPRNIDVRVLWYRRDLIASPPATWDAVLASRQPFGFTGRESGLFGLFFELVVGAGGALFDEHARPTMDTPAAVEAVEVLVELAARAPAELPEWHYDQVDAALLAGQVAMAAAWPGGTAAIRGSDLADRLAPAPYPAGRARWVSYSGCHGWAVPRTCGDVDGALELILTRLVSEEGAARETTSGGIPALAAALAALEPQDDTDAVRLDVTRRTIAEAMITYPPLERFPAVEDAGWSMLNMALRGQVSAEEAVRQLQAAAESTLRDA